MTPASSTSPDADFNSGFNSGLIRDRFAQADRGGAPYCGTVAGKSVEQRVRKICLALPEVTEKRSHGAPAFSVGKQFVMLWSNGHHDRMAPHLWCAAPPGVQHDFVAHHPERFFRPPYVGSRGWLGVRLDGPVLWDEVEMLCEEAYRTVAPRRLLAVLDQNQDV